MMWRHVPQNSELRDGTAYDLVDARIRLVSQICPEIDAIIGRGFFHNAGRDVELYTSGCYWVVNLFEISVYIAGYMSSGVLCLIDSRVGRFRGIIKDRSNSHSLGKATLYALRLWCLDEEFRIWLPKPKVRKIRFR